MEKTPNDSINEIAILATDGQHVKIDPALMQIQNIGYVVTSHQTDGVIIDYSDTIWSQTQDYLGYELVYNKTCVGRTYAWKLNTWAKILSQTTNNQGEVVNTLGNMHLELTETGPYWDQNNGNYTPFWQAFSGSSWNNLIYDHPYKRVPGYSQTATEGLWSYPFYEVNNFSSNTGGGPYYDGDGFQITSGKLVEKKLDQFQGFNNIRTDLNNMFPSYGMNTQGWINYYNAYHTADLNTFPSPLQWFNNGINPNGLACFGDVFNNTVIDNNWNSWVEGIYAAVADLDSLFPVSGGSGGFSWQDFIDLHENIANLQSIDGDIITGVSITSFKNRSFLVEMSNQDGKFKLMTNNEDIVPGLYQLILHTSDGNAILSYYGINNTLPEAKLSDYVDLRIAPNPMVDGQLNIELNSSSPFSGQLWVNDFYGNLVHSQPVSVVANNTQLLKLEINSNSLQLLISLILPDGSLVQTQVLNP